MTARAEPRADAGAVSLAELMARLDAALAPEGFDDNAPNGLQVEGRARVRRVITGVSANQALIDAAVAADADALIVHHGFFWRSEPRTVVGLRRRRLATLLASDVSLIAYHLPLDGHAVLGNNAQLAAAIGATQDGSFPVGGGLSAPMARLDAELTLAELAARVEGACGRAPLVLPGGPRPIWRVAVCTGGAAGAFEAAAARGCDAYVTGEPSEPSQGLARELGVHFIAAGHHATERFGVRALAAFVREELGIDAFFVDVPNDV